MTVMHIPIPDDLKLTPQIYDPESGEGFGAGNGSEWTGTLPSLENPSVNLIAPSEAGHF